MFLFFQDLLVGLIAWGFSVYAVKKLATIMFLHPHNYSDWMMLIMYKPISILIAGSLMILSTYILYQLCKRHVSLLLVRRATIGMERGIHVVILLYGILLLLIQGSKFPWVSGTVLVILLVYDLAQLFVWQYTRDS
ncbi:hypothetical protein ACQCN2_04100 [Brevibacillus ginsengisoli]|uniref:hypothetical protein n=1 Tax=Brevibacillus ginsengisoli TaxID=363854 RepID=UPI003CF402E5